MACAPLLGGWGSQTLLATSLTEALKLTPEELADVDLMVVDYHLDAQADGVQCIEALQAHCGSDIPAIVITADRTAAVRSAALSRGFQILNKPIKPAVLRALITRLIAARQAAE